MESGRERVVKGDQVGSKVCSHIDEEGRGGGGVGVVWLCWLSGSEVSCYSVLPSGRLYRKGFV